MSETNESSDTLKALQKACFELANFTNLVKFDGLALVRVLIGKKVFTKEEFQTAREEVLQVIQQSYEDQQVDKQHIMDPSSSMSSSRDNDISSNISNNSG